MGLRTSCFRLGSLDGTEDVHQSATCNPINRGCHGGGHGETRLKGKIIQRRIAVGVVRWRFTGDALCEVAQKYVSGGTDISIGHVSTQRASVGFAAPEFSIQPTTSPTGLARIILSYNDYPTPRMLSRLVDEVLSESEVRPSVHHAGGLVADAACLASFGHAGGLELGDEHGIIVLTEPQGGLPVSLVDYVPDSFPETTCSPLHACALFVPMHKSMGTAVVLQHRCPAAF